MSYQVLARKWRPQSFDALIGQEPIVTALSNGLREGRIAQAYLFSGIRGVGKTTAARLLAKALNCQEGPTPEPCNRCPMCVEITRGADLDVIEVDAATYSKVEQVRELAESLRYGPARDRYKVAVLDEIHRLSRQAFDALLKIVEEPPAHLVFIFATTEIEAVPVTLLSRCQEFHFRRVGAETLAEHLRKLAQNESITASDAALRLIARAGEGSVRDAVALLDQLATFGAGAIADDDAVRLLGGLDLELFRTLLAALGTGDRAAVTGAVARIEEEGFDPRHVFAQFLRYCRDGLHLALGGAPGPLDLPAEDAAALGRLATDLGYENLLRLLHHLLTSEPLVRRSELGMLAVEIAWLKAAELPKLVRVEELLRGGPPPAAETAPPRLAARAPGANAPPLSLTPPVDPKRPGTVEAFLDEVARRRQPLAALLSRDSRFADGVLYLVPLPGDTLLAKRFEQAAARAVLEEAAASTFGLGARLELLPAGLATAAPAASAPPVEPDLVRAESVQTVLRLFDGTVEAVEKHDSLGED
jgi:DNA polymerase-3 subunit gamma/tau